MPTVIDDVVARLEEAGLTVNQVTSAPPDEGADAMLEIAYGRETKLYDVEVKTRISPASAYAVVTRPERRLLLIAPHISDQVAESLRRRDIHYADSVGNMHLRWGGVLIDVRGRRAANVPQPGQPGRPLRLFRSGGLKVVFLFLTDPDFVDRPYRAIAQAAGVSLGTVHWVLKEMEGAGYATAAPRRLYRTRELLNRWVEGYSLDLHPRLDVAHFDAPDPTWWETADDEVRASEAQWGGETAAHRWNPRLRPQSAVLYVAEIPNRLAVKYRFRKAGADGNVTVRYRFWGSVQDSSLTVPTPLVYADLIASADPRLVEAAAELRENDALLGRLDRS